MKDTKMSDLSKEEAGCINDRGYRVINKRKKAEIYHGEFAVLNRIPNEAVLKAKGE